MNAVIERTEAFDQSVSYPSSTIFLTGVCFVLSGATGLEAPEVSLGLTRADQTHHQVAVGQTVGEEGNRYVGLAGAEGTFVISKASYESLIKALKDLRPDAAAAAEPSADGKPASSTASGSSSDAGVPGVSSSTSTSP